MFNKKDYREAISHLKASEATHQEVLNMAKERNKIATKGRRSVVLIAAVVALMAMTVTAFASEYVQNWFVSYFSRESEEPLSQGQVAFIEDNEQYLEESLITNGWTVELRSTFTDGLKGYIILGITAPENISLKDIPQKSKSIYYGPGNDYLPKSENAVLHCSAYPNFGGVLANIRSCWLEDGDGFSNTVNYIIDVAPDVEWAEKDPFDANSVWQIHIENLVCGFPEQTILAEGTWDFDFTFEYEKKQIQILNEPMKTRAWVFMPDATEVESVVTITSVFLQPFGITLHYGDISDGLDYSRISVQFTDSMTGRYPWYAVMKDGSKIELFAAGGNPNKQYVYLEASVPIVLDDVAYILLSDGTELKVP